jgi:putative ABC transport system permease protein
MKFLPLIWAWSLRRPTSALLNVAAVTIAFTLYGMALGVAQGFLHAPAAQRAGLGQDLMPTALGISAPGMALILFLTASATAQSVRLRIAEFGVMKAIGFSHRLIILLVATQAILPCLVGAAAGLGAAKLLYIPLATWIPSLALLSGLLYTPAILAGAMGLALFIGVISGVLPAARIIRLEAAAALAGDLRPAAGPARREVPLPQAIAASPAALQRSGRDDINYRSLPRQILAVTRTGLSTLPRRWKGAVVVVAALTVVTMVMNPLLIFIDSFERANMTRADPLRAVVSHLGVNSNSPIADDWIAVIKAAPGIARMPDGSPMASAMVNTTMTVHGATCGVRQLGGPAGICPPCPLNYCPGVTGIEPAGFAMQPELKLLSGRLPRPGSNDIILGEQVQLTRPDLKIGSILRNNYLQAAGALAMDPKLKSDATIRNWRVTGFFSSGNTARDLQGFGDYRAFLQADPMRYTNRVVVRLASRESFAAFRAALRAHPEMKIHIEREEEFYARVTSSNTGLRARRTVAYILGTLLGFGALMGVLHVMRGTLETRATEIAILWAVGFDGLCVALSVILEALLLAVLGALLGMLALTLWYQGRLFGGGIATVSPSVVGFAVLWAIAIALLGTIFPAMRTARQTPIEALREV